MSFTSTDEGHRHQWFDNRSHTSRVGGHKHRVNRLIGVAEAERFGGHSHKLI